MVGQHVACPSLNITRGTQQSNSRWSINMSHVLVLKKVAPGGTKECIIIKMLEN